MHRLSLIPPGHMATMCKHINIPTVINMSYDLASINTYTVIYVLKSRTMPYIFCLTHFSNDRKVYIADGCIVGKDMRVSTGIHSSRQYVCNSDHPTNVTTPILKCKYTTALQCKNNNNNNKMPRCGCFSYC